MPYKDPEKRREAHRRYYRDSPEYRLKKHERSVRRRKSNPESGRLHSKKYRDGNKEKVNENIRIWKAENRHKVNAQKAERRASIVTATPAWLTQSHRQAIASVYKQAKTMEAQTGVKHHVDHIVPLKGRYVCGLHVPWNLQAIPAKENISKGNRLPAVLPETQHCAIMAA